MAVLMDWSASNALFQNDIEGSHGLPRVYQLSIAVF